MKNQGRRPTVAVVGPKPEAVVAEVLVILMARCDTSAELLDVLAPLSAAALRQRQAQPADVEQWFLRVTALLDAGDG